MDHDEAYTIVAIELKIDRGGIIHCTNEQWGSLSEKVRKAVFYLLDEWDYGLAD